MAGSKTRLFFLADHFEHDGTSF